MKIIIFALLYLFVSCPTYAQNVNKSSFSTGYYDTAIEAAEAKLAELYSALEKANGELTYLEHNSTGSESFLNRIEKNRAWVEILHRDIETQRNYIQQLRQKKYNLQLEEKKSEEALKRKADEARRKKMVEENRARQKAEAERQRAREVANARRRAEITAKQKEEARQLQEQKMRQQAIMEARGQQRYEEVMNQTEGSAQRSADYFDLQKERAMELQNRKSDPRSSRPNQVPVRIGSASRAKDKEQRTNTKDILKKVSKSRTPKEVIIDDYDPYEEF
ncbi:hypothetical protein [Prevotella sp.]|uniref:hypothetical protein n=1 Tax=uncultured Prevotella sp. TaxID=159272 RepID=UPI0027E38A08|nr:hypothetical protein [Prevotella sp.]